LIAISIAKPTLKSGGGAKPAHPRWIAPIRGFAKVNVDAAMNKSSPCGAVGLICQSGEGDFIGASTLTVSGITDPVTMEAIGGAGFGARPDATQGHDCVGLYGGYPSSE
jgi:hypothetical protein